MLINHQKAKHFKCLYCYKKLNSGSGLVIHIAQLHKETVVKIPNALDGHDTPEVEIYGMDGIPEEDMKRHREGLPIAPYRRSRLIEPGTGIVSLLASQKAAVPEMPAEPVPTALSVKSMPPPIPGLGGTSNPVSPHSSTTDDSSRAVERPGMVSAAPVSYASPPMPMPYPGYPQYAQYPGYPPAPYYPQPPYGYQGYAPPPYYPPQYYPGTNFASPPPLGYPPTPMAPTPAPATPYTTVPTSPIADEADARAPAVKVEPTVDEAGNQVPGEYIMVSDTDISMVRVYVSIVYLMSL